MPFHVFKVPSAANPLSVDFRLFLLHVPPPTILSPYPSSSRTQVQLYTHIHSNYRMDHRRKAESRGNVLTPALVVAKAKSDSLQNIKNLNLWGNDLQDLKLIREMPSLEVLSLSVNKISSLKDFSYCPKLRQLFLRKNNIHDIREIKYLTDLPLLTELWLHDNPCANVENYREIVIKHLPRLQKLDNVDVTNQDRARAQRVNFNLDSYDSNEDEEPGYGRKSQRVDEYQEQSRPSTKDQYVRQHSSRQQAMQQQLKEGAIRSREQKLEYQQNQGYRQPPSGNHQKQPPSQQKPRFGRGQQRVSKQEPVGKWDRPYNPSGPQPSGRNRNVLLAVMSLLKELDEQSLQIVRVQIDKLLND